MTILKLTNEDFQTIYEIVNEAALSYKGKIPADCYKTPYMPPEELQEEIEAGVEFFGYSIDGLIVAVMGIQFVADVTLIRHAYTLTNYQSRGIGDALLRHLLGVAKTHYILVGTWENAPWAIRFYQKHGFRLQSREETNRLLGKYWNISKHQLDTSVVLQQRRQK
jgi:ribosomal protein S18 acetylase RimI-like enzyme